MRMENLDMIADELADNISSTAHKAIELEEKAGSVLIPTAEFAEIAKARNEQMKQENEQEHWRVERYKADLEERTRKAEIELEQLKLEQTLELEKLRMANEVQVAETRAAAEKEAAEIGKEAADTRSKRDLIGKVLDFLGRVLVAIFGLGVAIYQANTIRREEENDTFVNSRSMNFWHKPKF